ncbi:MAG: virulence factor MviN, partial [Intrasporangiaceae bacterium]|nr:virulence factor MviN [Intrasporangiaceae bacterium]
MTGARAGRVAGGIAGAAGLIAILTLVARAAGFGRVLVFADSVRASGIGDVYNAVNAVPNVVHEVAAGGALAALTVPLIAGHLGRGDRDEAFGVASTLLTWALVILVPLAGLVWVLAEPITGLLIGSAVDGGVPMGTAMLRIFALQIPLYGIGIVLSGLLHAHQRFAAVALAPLLSSLVVIATYAAYGSIAEGATTDLPPRAVSLLGWGTTAGVAALALPLLLPAWRTGWRFRPSLRFTGDDAARARRLAGAGLLALAAQQIATLVALRLATQHGGGQGAASVYTWILAVVMLP